MSLEQKSKNDSEKIMRFIESHPKFDAIYSAFMKGPDPQSGFMWTTTEWWSPEEGEAIKIVSNKVLDYDWDSSGYGYMMRVIESKIKALQVVDGVLVKNVENPEEEEEKLDSEKKFAKSYQQTSFGKAMDDNNKKALDVMAKKGADEAANYMMAQAGGDYARMRSMFG